MLDGGLTSNSHRTAYSSELLHWRALHSREIRFLLREMTADSMTCYKSAGRTSVIVDNYNGMEDTPPRLDGSGTTPRASRQVTLKALFQPR